MGHLSYHPAVGGRKLCLLFIALSECYTHVVKPACQKRQLILALHRDLIIEIPAPQNLAFRFQPADIPHRFAHAQNHDHDQKDDRKEYLCYHSIAV